MSEVQLIRGKDIENYLQNSKVDTTVDRVRSKSKEDRTYLFDPYQAGTVGKLGYVLTGWYKTRTLDSTSTEDNPSYTYSDPFDFETEKVGIEGLTLYAC